MQHLHRFAPLSGREAFAQLTSLEQRGSAWDYSAHFQQLVRLAGEAHLTPAGTLWCYTRGLRPELQVQVHIQRPATLQAAMSIAHGVDDVHAATRPRWQRQRAARRWQSRARKWEHSCPADQEL